MKTPNYKIDVNKISTPIVKLSNLAKSQLQLMQKQDFSLHGLVLRIGISGKNCEGFTYSIGFSKVIEADFQVVKDDLTIHFDPFAAFYLQMLEIDYEQDWENNREGFSVKNLKQDEFAGKFWKMNQNKTPPVIEVGETD